MMRLLDAGYLNYPSPSFLPFLAVDYMKVVPKHVVDTGTDINNWKNIVGSGPFKIVRAWRGDSVTYERNPNYFKPGLPYLDQLTVLAMSDAGTAAAAIKANKIIMTTAATALSIEDMVKLGTDLRGQVSLYWQPEVTDGWHVFANVEREPWTDLRIIQALRLATDQQEHQKAFGVGQRRLRPWIPQLHAVEEPAISGDVCQAVARVGSGQTPTNSARHGALSPNRGRSLYPG